TSWRVHRSRSSRRPPRFGATRHVDERIHHHRRSKGKDDGRYCAEQDEVHGHLADALEDEHAEASAADQCRNGGKPDILDQHDADTGENNWKGEGKLDAPEAL